MNHPLRSMIARALEEREAAGLLRSPPRTQPRSGIHYRINGRDMVSFCSNDYLGFGAEPLNIESIRSGAASSRYIHAESEALCELEGQLAFKLGYPAGLLYPSGYQGNVAALAQLPLPPNGQIYSDALNHASIIDALRLHSAKAQIIEHGSTPPASPRNWWICESRYSMDGDRPELAAVDRYLKKGGLLFLDEAHSIGLGPGGRGFAAELSHNPHLAAHPLGKAFGLQGSFIAGSLEVIAWLRQFSRATIYSTALAPWFLNAVSQRGAAVFGDFGDERRARLSLNLSLVEDILERKVDGPIFSYPCPGNHAALRLSQALLERGFHVQAIRPPTVPPNGARLRITLSALHQPEEIRGFFKTLQDLS